MMFWRALVVALVCASAAALTPLSAAGDDNDCALYLAGPGRTSAYDYRLNLLRGNFGYDGQHTCITYDAVNQAYQDARKRILVSQPKGDWTPEDFASVGELVLDISINLARTYGLTYEEIEKGLPLIDTSRTQIREVCPPVFSHVECRAGKYRRLDGLCNNLRQPTWGATMAPFQRLIGPLFADGINAPRIAHSGRDLPLSRVVSRTMHPDDGFHDHAGTVMVIAWGQFMDHDYTLTGTPLDPRNRNDPEECCKRPPHLKHPYCNEIRIPDDDYFYRLFGVKCIDFVRGFPSPRPGCRLGSRVPFNTLTGAIDGNTVYGVTEKFARKLRTGYGGLLRMNPVFEEYGLKDLLPLKLDIPDEGCTRPNKNMYCFEAGEIRVNEQLVLTVMHTLMAREHNRVAKGLAAVNPHWDDETLYQEARRINIAEIQHITYNEFLPVLLGKDVMEKFGLVLEKQGYWDGYDQNVNPDVIDAFAAAAYRFGHSLLPTAVERWSKAHKFIASKRLSDLIRRPYDLYRAGVLDEYVMGLMNQVAQAMDDSITQEVTNHLFKKIGARFGMDLVSFNMQRGREFGLPGYMEFRKFCGLSGAETFQDLFGSMPNETVRKYESIFEHPVDVDLWSGGVSERPLPGSMLGPTFACIIATQFSYSRRGDRFWFELPNQPSSFTPEQLKEVRKARLARVICDNTDIIDTTQLYPFVLPDHELNPRVPCRSGIIPSIDFSKWAEPPPFAANAKQFVTDAIVSENKAADLCQDHFDANNTFSSNGTKYNGCRVKSTQNTTNIDKAPRNLSVININGTTTDFPINYNTTKASTNKTTELSPDTIMKYVYKDNEKTEIDNKAKGPIRNKLRKRRSVEETSESRTAPLIVNYETTHTPGVVLTPYLKYPLKKQSENYVQPSALADFSLQTLHDRPIVVLDPKEVQNGDNNDKEAYKNKDDLRKSPLPEITESSESQSAEHSGELQESNDRQEQDDDERLSYKKEPNNNSEESNEGGEKDSGEREEKNDYKSHNQSSSDESKEEDTSRESANASLEEDASKSNENENISSSDKSELRRPKDTSEEYLHKQRKEQSNDRDISKSSEEQNDSGESNEKQDHSNQVTTNDSIERLKERHQEFKQPENPLTAFSRDITENENKQHRKSSKVRLGHKPHGESESNLFTENNFKPKPFSKLLSSIKDEVNSKRPVKIQNVDLGDFSYERVKINDKGVVEPIKEERENNDEASSAKDNPLAKMKPRSHNENADYTRKINDGEIKPVVEISQSNESSEEKEQDIPPNLNLNEGDASEESGESSEKTGKIIHRVSDPKESPKNIKQEFERIPVNYNHDKIHKENSHKVRDHPTTADTPAESEEHDKNDEDDDQKDKPKGTIPSKSVKYDEDSSIKFLDTPIKLPEIKLPEDVLTFEYKEPEENNEKFYQHASEEDEESDSVYRDEDDGDDDDDTHYGPYKSYYKDRTKDKNRKKQDHKEAEDENEDVDLYEKFVRERFGKRDSFRKRSEELQQRSYAPDPRLYEAIGKILKKTEETNKQAEKSGDPNAKYMWSLEYGEKL